MDTVGIEVILLVLTLFSVDTVGIEVNTMEIEVNAFSIKVSAVGINTFLV